MGILRGKAELPLKMEQAIPPIDILPLRCTTKSISRLHSSGKGPIYRACFLLASILSANECLYGLHARDRFNRKDNHTNQSSFWYPLPSCSDKDQRRRGERGRRGHKMMPFDKKKKKAALRGDRRLKLAEARSKKGFDARRALQTGTLSHQTKLK